MHLNLESKPAGNEPGDPQTRTARLAERKQMLVLLICVVALVVGVYWPMTSSQALIMDDGQYLLDNHLIQNPSWHSVKRFFAEVRAPSTVGGYYHPLAMTSLMLDVARGGCPEFTEPFRRMSIVLHVLNTALVVLALYQLFGRAWPAAIAGVLFGLHPVTVEPTVWIADRKTLLATFFGLLALVAYLRNAQRPRLVWMAACTIAYLLALLSKPTVIPLPAAMLVLDAWPLRRLGRRALLEKLPLFVLAAVSAVITVISHGNTASLIAPTPRDAGAVLLQTCSVIPFYLRTLLWPLRLTPYYPPPEPVAWSNPALLWSAVFMGVLVVVLCIWHKRLRTLIAGLAVFVILLLPTMGAVRFTTCITADRYVYLPVFGLLVVVCAAMGVVMTSAAGRKVVFALAAVLVVLLGLRTRDQISLWSNSETLCAWMIDRAPEAAELHMEMATLLARSGEFEAAIEQYEAVLARLPDHPDTHVNLSYLHLNRREFVQAEQHALHALRTLPNDPKAMNNLALAMAGQKRFDDAVAVFLRLVARQPDDPEAEYNCGLAFAAKNDWSGAAEHFRRATRIEPRFEEARERLVLALLHQKQPVEALAVRQESLQLAPDSSMAMNNLSWLVSTCEFPAGTPLPDPVELARKALEISPGEAMILDTLAAAYAYQGRFEEAVKTAEKAVRVARAERDIDSYEEFKARVELFRKGQVYREPLPGTATTKPGAAGASPASQPAATRSATTQPGVN